MKEDVKKKFELNSDMKNIIDKLHGICCDDTIDKIELDKTLMEMLKLEKQVIDKPIGLQKKLSGRTDLEDKKITQSEHDFIASSQAYIEDNYDVSINEKNGILTLHPDMTPFWETSPIDEITYKRFQYYKDDFIRGTVSDLEYVQEDDIFHYEVLLPIGDEVMKVELDKGVERDVDPFTITGFKNDMEYIEPIDLMESGYWLFEEEE